MKGLFNSRHDTRVGEPGKKTDPGVSSNNPWPKERFRDIYDAHYDDLWRYCLRRSVDTTQAEEALASTFKVAWQKLDEVPTGDATRPWLFTVAKNHLRNSWRKSKRRNEVTEMLINEVVTTKDCLDPAEIVTESATEILQAFGNLREADQEVLRLACWEDLRHIEIANILGCSVNAVGIRIHRAREKLANRIDQEALKGFSSPEHVRIDGAIRSEGDSNG